MFRHYIQSALVADRAQGPSLHHGGAQWNFKLWRLFNVSGKSTRYFMQESDMWKQAPKCRLYRRVASFSDLIVLCMWTRAPKCTVLCVKLSCVIVLHTWTYTWRSGDSCQTQIYSMDVVAYAPHMSNGLGNKQERSSISAGLYFCQTLFCAGSVNICAQFQDDVTHRLFKLRELAVISA